MDEVSIAITLGEGKEFAITKDNQLVVQTTNSTGFHADRINLGLCTTRRIEQLQEYLERLKVHAQ